MYELEFLLGFGNSNLKTFPERGMDISWNTTLMTIIIFSCQECILKGQNRQGDLSQRLVLVR